MVVLTPMVLLLWSLIWIQLESITTGRIFSFLHIVNRGRKTHMAVVFCIGVGTPPFGWLGRSQTSTSMLGGLPKCLEKLILSSTSQTCFSAKKRTCGVYEPYELLVSKNIKTRRRLIYMGALFCASELGSSENEKLQKVFGNVWAGSLADRDGPTWDPLAGAVVPGLGARHERPRDCRHSAVLV